MSEVLDAQQIESFVEFGYCMLAQAFSARQADAACQCVWRRMQQKAGIVEADPSTWPKAYDIEEHLWDAQVLDCFSDSLAAAVAQLVGPGRWCGERRWGLWPVNFSVGRDQPYDFPTSGWHIDGNWFRHTINSPKQGLVLIGLFTDIASRGGGTILALGSHKRTAQVLARHPEGISHVDVFYEVLSEPLGNFHEVTGRAGDVALCHPFLFHTRGMKHVGAPRIISNTEASLHAPMDLNRADPDAHSVLERSIRQALRESLQPPRAARICRF
jgi:hypothetical protein